jgi:hypothetical protein
MSDSQDTFYPIMAMQAMWHAAADAIDLAAAADVDEDWMLAPGRLHPQGVRPSGQPLGRRGASRRRPALRARAVDARFRTE